MKHTYREGEEEEEENFYINVLRNFTILSVYKQEEKSCDLCAKLHTLEEAVFPPFPLLSSFIYRTPIKIFSRLGAWMHVHTYSHSTYRRTCEKVSSELIRAEKVSFN